MSPTFNWGIVAPGGIAEKFARHIPKINGARLTAVWGRNFEKAKAFASKFKIERVHHSIEDLANDPSVALVYVATPHPAHYEFARRMLEAGKGVLCEKPICMNAEETSALIEVARTSKAFLMEAMWTRFLPAVRKAQEIIESGAIGKVELVQSSFCIAANPDPTKRWINPELGGGALLDLGIYNVAATKMFLTGEPTEINATARFTEWKTDERTDVLMKFPQGEAASFHCGIATQGRNALVICGEKGFVELPPMFIRAEEVIQQPNGERAKKFRFPFRVEGFEYEMEEVHKCMLEGRLESPRMTHEDSLVNIRTLDRIRSVIGLKYEADLRFLTPQ